MRTIISLREFGIIFVALTIVAFAASGCALTINTEPDEPVETSPAYIPRPRRVVGGGLRGNGAFAQMTQAGTAPDWRDLPVGGVSIGTPPLGCPPSRVYLIHNGNCGSFEARIMIDRVVLFDPRAPHEVTTEAGDTVLVFKHNESAYYCIPHPEEVHTAEFTAYRPTEAGLAERIGEWPWRFRPNDTTGLNTGNVISCQGLTR